MHNATRMRNALVIVNNSVSRFGAFTQFGFASQAPEVLGWLYSFSVYEYVPGEYERWRSKMGVHFGCPETESCDFSENGSNEFS